MIDVGGRYIFNKPLFGAIEMSEFLMVFLSFGGLALAELRNRHITVDFFVGALPARVRALLEAAGALLGVVFWGFVAWRATVHARRIWEAGEVSANLAVPTWPFYLAVTVGCGLARHGPDRPHDPLSAHRVRLMDNTTIGVIGFAAMLGLMFLGVPIGVAMGAVGFFGFAWVNGWNSALNMLALAPYSAVATYVLSVVPLFVLMGHIANETGIGRELYATAQIWLKHRRGGLAMATVAACAGFAAISGSSVATAATMTTVALPQMRKMGYDPKLATGSVAAGGTLGILIPPSVIFLIYGFLTETSIGKLFLAGVLPGILLTVMFVFTIAIVTWHNPKLAPTVAGARQLSRSPQGAARGVGRGGAVHARHRRHVRRRVHGDGGRRHRRLRHADPGADARPAHLGHAVALARQHGRDGRHHHGDPGRRGGARLLPGRHAAADEALAGAGRLRASPPPASC